MSIWTDRFWAPPTTPLGLCRVCREEVEDGMLVCARCRFVQTPESERLPVGWRVEVAMKPEHQWNAHDICDGPWSWEAFAPGETEPLLWDWGFVDEETARRDGVRVVARYVAANRDTETERTVR